MLLVVFQISSLCREQLLRDCNHFLPKIVSQIIFLGNYKSLFLVHESFVRSHPNIYLPCLLDIQQSNITWLCITKTHITTTKNNLIFQLLITNSGMFVVYVTINKKMESLFSVTIIRRRKIIFEIKMEQGLSRRCSYINVYVIHRHVQFFLP